MTENSRPRPVKETEAWARNLTELRVANELMMAGIGGLLETVASPAAIHRRLRELWDIGHPVRADLDVDRTVGSLAKRRTASAPFEHHECPRCGFEYKRVTRQRVRVCDDCRQVAARERRSA